jgi:GTP-binding protein Era
MAKRCGVVLILGRPNVGKSTFINAILNRKVSITSPRPQTTRRPLKAIYEDERGQLLFIDTPGIFKKAEDLLSKRINQKTLEAVNDNFDLVLYMIDHTRHRDFEEGRVLGLVRQIKKPKILLINKIDEQKESYLAEYHFLEDEVDEVFKISALKKQHLKPVLETIFNKVNRPYPLLDSSEFVGGVTNMHSRDYLEDIIREKIYLFTRQEVPYKTEVKVEEIKERNTGVLYIRATILTADKRYKKILIGKNGQKVQEIGYNARKELEVATEKKVYLDLKVEADYHLGL